MKKLFVLIGTTAGSSLGWWLGSPFGLYTSFLVSMCGLGFGMWYGARMAARYEP
ncbi:hypothetical protein [Gemmatimonas phototrophica]|uniref:hypothetical protein n=1 Tax=Gemmatimonas phototrophica TaxID=1379270 RepID=UPI000AE7BC51|nr:hypothetical protein [Gemmatimonas phototrophica]